MKKSISIFKILVTSVLISMCIFGCANPSKVADDLKKTMDDITNIEVLDNPISGPLNVTESWPGKDDNGNPITYYIDSIFFIKEGGSLIIGSGAIVKFGIHGGITVNNTGYLEASDVIFTSFRDSRGRKILSGGEGAPVPGDWKQIKISGGACKFTNCEFSYGGNDCSTVYVCKNTTAGRAKISGCKFTYNAGSKKLVSNIDAALEYDDSVVYNENDNCVTDTVFEHNVWPVSIPAFFSFSGTNKIKYNDYNYININSYNINNNVRWEKLDAPYISLNTSEIKINSGATLTIEGGILPEVPNEICFGTKGIHIYKGGELDLTGYVTFRNSPESENTLFNGIYCAKSYKFKIDKTNISVSTVLLTPSEDFKIINYEPTDKSYTTDKNAEYRKEQIKDKNFYEIK